MGFGRFLRGLAGLGARKLGRKLEERFEGLDDLGYYNRVMKRVPKQKQCSCTGWHGKLPKKAGNFVTTLYAGCRGPKAVAYELQVHVPGMQYRKVDEQGRRVRDDDVADWNWKTIRHAAEAEIVTYAGGDSTHPRRRHLGYFRTVAAAKRAAREAVQRRCRKPSGLSGDCIPGYTCDEED